MENTKFDYDEADERVERYIQSPKGQERMQRLLSGMKRDVDKSRFVSDISDPGDRGNVNKRRGWIYLLFASLVCAILLLGIVTAKETLACSCADGSDDIGKRFQESKELYAVKNLEVSEDLLTIRILQVLKGDRQLTGQIVKDIKLERASSCSSVPTVQSVGDIYITEHPGVFQVCSWPIELNLVFEDPSLLAKLRELDPNGLLEQLWIGAEKEKFEQKQDYLRFQLGEFKMGEIQRAWFLEDTSHWHIMLAIFLGIAIPFAAGGARAGTRRAFSCALIMLVAMTVSLIVFLLSFDWLYTKDIELWMFVILFIYIFGFALSMYIALRKPKTSPL